MTTTAVVPLKALNDAKGRLANAVPAGERRKLVAWMLDRVLRACETCPDIDDVLVVAGDERSAELAAAHPSVSTIVVKRPGLSAAMAAADRATQGAATTIVVAADLPELTAQDLSAVLAAAHGCSRAVVLSRTSDGGTGALLRRPPDIITTAFGPGSAGIHMSLARAAGITPRRVDRPGLVRDVDTPAQLAALNQRVVAFPPG